jgi:signal transduction histidine kinase
MTLLRTIADIPALVDRWSPEATLLLPPAISFIGQRLVELIGQILECKVVLLLSLGPPADHLYYVAKWGLTPEQERRLRENSGRFSLSDFFDEKTLAHLYANKEVSITHDRTHVPFLNRFDLGSRNILLTPIFLRKQIAGILVIARANLNDVYTSEEIALVKAVATLITLVIECVRALNKLDGTNTREFVLQETNQLINEFLNITSHELRTPLTATMGNIQLAQRRLEALKRHATDLSETLSKYIKQVQQPLENASQSAQLQEQIIRNMIDDARIQSHTLTLHMRRCNLIKLVQEVVAKRQQQAPERRIILDIRHTEETVPIIADADRIKQVIDIYLTNALNYSPGDRTVTVQLTVEGSMARVSVHDEGPGIPPEEQEHIWKRFYRAKGIAVQHELDLSLGLSLYICQELIKYHHGGVGLQSVPDHGSTFWFTLPVATQQE